MRRLIANSVLKASICFPAVPLAAVLYFSHFLLLPWSLMLPCWKCDSYGIKTHTLADY